MSAGLTVLWVLQLTDVTRVAGVFDSLALGVVEPNDLCLVAQEVPLGPIPDTLNQIVPRDDLGASVKRLGNHAHP